MDQQTPPTNEPAAADAGSGAPLAVSSALSRRRLLRAGAAASPVLLTFASSPVAATSSCVVASSFVSASVYKSRNPGATQVGCIPKTAQQLCIDAKNQDRPHKQSPLCLTLKALFPSTTFPTTPCGDVFYNNGAGLSSSGDVAIQQRLIALRIGNYGNSATGFDEAYCLRVWNNRSGAGLATLVGVGNGSWDQTRLIKWLDYVANGVALP